MSVRDYGREWMQAVGSGQAGVLACRLGELALGRMEELVNSLPLPIG